METWSPNLCGSRAKVAYCDSGLKRRKDGAIVSSDHEYARSFYCGREWCPVCGKKWSVVHKRKFARWLPKAQTIDSMGFIVITFPMELRKKYADPKKLKSFRRRVIRALKYRGYDRGLSKWHYFGEEYPGKYHPHLNILVPGGNLTEEELDEFKELIGYFQDNTDKVNVYYQYSTDVKQKVHWLKYVTKATFTDCTWDAGLADQLYGFHHCQSWGKWKGLPLLWELPENDDSLKELEGVAVLESGRCPVCGGALHWNDHVEYTDTLLEIGFKVWGAGWLFRIRAP